MHGKRTSRLVLAALLATVWACSDESFSPTEGPAADEALGFDEVAASEIATSGYLGDLSDEERAGVRAAFARAHASLADIRARLDAGTIDRAQAMAEVRLVHERLHEELAAFLTPDQIRDLRDRRHDRPWLTDLRLTPEQAREIRAIWNALHDELAEIARKLHAGELGPEEARALAHQVTQRAQAAICDVLNDEQAAKVRFCA
jgi:hypothetical protein